MLILALFIIVAIPLIICVLFILPFVAREKKQNDINIRKQELELKMAENRFYEQQLSIGKRIENGNTYEILDPPKQRELN